MENPEEFLLTAGGKITCLRCTAMSKNTRLQCLNPALNVSRTQKCGFHGGKSTGPKTAEGKARIGAAHLTNGNYTKKAQQEFSRTRLALVHLEDIAHVLGVIAAPRTVGRKPKGYTPIRTKEQVRNYVAAQDTHGESAQAKVVAPLKV